MENIFLTDIKHTIAILFLIMKKGEMKILIVVFTYYPNKDGVQNVTQYQAEGLARLGHDVTVLTGFRFTGTDIEIEDYNGVHIRRIDCFDEWMLHFGNKKGYQSLLYKYAEAVDVIMTVCPQSWCTDWAIPIIKKLPCAKVMMVHGLYDFRWNKFDVHGLYAAAQKIWGGIRWTCFFAGNWENIRQYDAVIQLHEQDFGARYFRNHGVEKESVLYNAVDDAFFQINGKKKNQIINVGTYNSRKNQMLCLDAFYLSRLYDWELVLIGQKKNKYYGKLLRRRDELEKKYGHRNVRMLADISRKETIELIQESKIYLLTSTAEMFPVSLIEGMAAGCAWISTDVGINRYLPGGVVCNTPLEIAEKLNQYIQNDLWRKLGEEGRKFVEKNCKQDIQIRCLERILREAVNYYVKSGGRGNGSEN